ncbi:sigma-70 family RNA polymerase sigma factor [Egibacter rhizosphaerae]|uniref:Sigma-70 family RNA polymerase sigma factor n=1 Tax=Egibacter rhizosphaerae TaxID=1670831 RepID=A0A411YG38_9ACTN|nr:sigma-70 family RNA polymerase sigma factor [Egibacter rhizosphaerae]QBI20235.1 sigma-70 family RNA polymerase sigma factor [Egibacter rhizosphaerae]
MRGENLGPERSGGVGDPASWQRFTRLFEQHYRAVVAYVWRRAGEQVAKDTASEAFLVAWRRLDELPGGMERAWLFLTARRVLANHWRRHREALGDGATWESPGESSADPADEVVHRLQADRVLSALPDSDREVVMLVAWEGLSLQELAVALDCRPGTARVRLHRARRRLERALADGDGEPTRIASGRNRESAPER